MNSRIDTLAVKLGALFLAAAIGNVPAKADDAGDPIAGRRLAAAWCTNCHALDASTQATVTGAPSFPAIAGNTKITPLAIRAFLQTQHQRMPDFHLSNDEADDLIAYILSMRH
jgi:mono/diheme cytochrome c family protein